LYPTPDLRGAAARTQSVGAEGIRGRPPNCSVIYALYARELRVMSRIMAHMPRSRIRCCGCPTRTAVMLAGTPCNAALLSEKLEPRPSVLRPYCSDDLLGSLSAG